MGATATATTTTEAGRVLSPPVRVVCTNGRTETDVRPLGPPLLTPLAPLPPCRRTSSGNQTCLRQGVPMTVRELGELRTKTGVGRGGDDGRSSPSLGGGITFDEFRVIMKGNAKLPTVKVPVGFD